MKAPSHILQTIADGLDLIANRWTLSILQAAFQGCCRFDEFLKHTGISRATLTRRLEELTEHNILVKTPSDHPRRFLYIFSERGLGLLNASLLARELEAAWSGEAPRPLKHTTCGHEFRAKLICEHCNSELHDKDITWQQRDHGIDELQELNQLQAALSSNGKSKRPRDSALNSKKGQSVVANIIGDRWCLLIIIAHLLKVSRFDDFLKLLNIAPSTLNARLKLLQEQELIEKEQYQENPPRYNYQLSKKGQMAGRFISELRQWILAGDGESVSSQLVHTPCGNSLKQKLVCECCGGVPRADELSSIK
ncbi:winged helix-turn-helix transcriptional regulator [Pseudoteredinibacter isoporae]|uniref:DNA-binding HxlR family transcriptional regulator n=1 Tax=Pseudoteredinibacter isoporae TaxID=570281 RepID=A0A7X0MUX3_9GAMM|nr:helix-turn-helix domain-containing protein [Pseudoteredinibacter isoporae]MBB6520758.1 DNA-binding HxlR family transcriptional regulator [Pseudoteredinibacter isoporae]NHO86324.1 helix-turn-helix transcriptional regulator [Pseudoteredinibacter isoporae]NIB25224.1 helix-turn-helix transcriptional regulator [Pseudoteredinibacter isoporae]